MSASGVNRPTLWIVAGPNGEADRVDVFENSGAAPTHVMSKAGDPLTILDDLIPELDDAVEAAFEGARWIGPET